MTLTDRIQHNAATRHQQRGPLALTDPSYATLLARARMRLRRDLLASAPDLPSLSPGDVEILEAMHSAGLPPVTAIISGEDRVGARQIAARLQVVDGQAELHVGVAILDEWGDLTFVTDRAPQPRLRGGSTFIRTA